jgi:hypothetical protein
MKENDAAEANDRRCFPSLERLLRSKNDDDEDNVKKVIADDGSYVYGLFDDRTGRLLYGCEYDCEGDLMYQGYYSREGKREGKKCLAFFAGDVVIYGEYRNGLPEGSCVYVYPNQNEIRETLCSRGTRTKENDDDRDDEEDDGGFENEQRVCAKGLWDVLCNNDYILGDFCEGKIDFEEASEPHIYISRSSHSSEEFEVIQEPAGAFHWLLEYLENPYEHYKEDLNDRDPKGSTGYHEFYASNKYCKFVQIQNQKMYAEQDDGSTKRAQSLALNEEDIFDEFEINTLTINNGLRLDYRKAERGELVALIANKRAIAGDGGEDVPGKKKIKGSSRRWRVKSRLAFLDDLSEGDDVDESIGLGGYFIDYLKCDVNGLRDYGKYESSGNRINWSDFTFGCKARVEVSKPFNCERSGEFYHFTFRHCVCLRAIETIERGDIITVGPDYSAGSRINPLAECGYYNHLANTPESLFYSQKEHLSKSTSKKRKRSEEEKVTNVKIKRHGPWLCAYLDDVEQGLIYDKTWKSDGENADDSKATIDREVIGFEYIRAMATIAIALGCRNNGWVVNIRTSTNTRVINLGFGTGALSGFIASVFKEKKDYLLIENVELSTQMLDATVRNPSITFSLFPNEKIVEQSADVFIEEYKTKKLCASIVFLDCYNGDGKIPKRCLNKSFIQGIYDCLSSLNGLLICNLFSENTGAVVEFMRTLDSCFGPSRSFCCSEPSGQSNNCIVVAEKSEAILNKSSESFAVLFQKLSGFNLKKDLRFSNLRSMEIFQSPEELEFMTA